MPLTKVTKKERTLQSKPWINKELNILCRKGTNCSKNIVPARMKFKKKRKEKKFTKNLKN